MDFSTTNAAVLTGVTVVTGRWAQGKTIEMKTVVGVMFLTIGLAVMSEFNTDLAQAFALLVLVASVYAYGPTIVRKAGLTK